MFNTIVIKTVMGIPGICYPMLADYTPFLNESLLIPTPYIAKSFTITFCYTKYKKNLIELRCHQELITKIDFCLFSPTRPH